MTTKIAATMLETAVPSQAAVDAAIAAAIATEVSARNAAITAAVGGVAASPPGTMAPFAGAAAPSGWLLAYGQLVNRVTYAALFTAIGTTFGVGDGSTTFGLPDMRGRSASGKDDMGGAAAGRTTTTLAGTKASTSNGIITGLSSTSALSVGMKAFGTGVGVAAVIASVDGPTQVTLSVNSTSAGATSIRFAVVDGVTLGAVGGAQVHLLTVGQMPAHTHDVPTLSGSGGVDYAVAGSQAAQATTTTSAGSSQAHPIMPPVVVLNYIIKT